MLHARYKASATITRTIGWGNVKGDKDQRCSDAAIQAGASPSGPPTNKLTSRASNCHFSRFLANCGVVQGLPSTSKVTMRLP